MISRVWKFFKKNPILPITLAFVAIAFSGLLTAPLTLRPTEFLRFWSYGNIVIKYSILNFHTFGLWDITSGNGFPLAPYLTSPFYPPTTLGFFMPDLLSIRVLAFLHIIFASIAMYFVLQTLRVSKIASAIGSLAFVINPYVQGSVQLGFISEIYNLPLMSLSFIFLWKGLFQNKNKYTILAGIFFGFHLLAMAIYSLYFTLIILLSLLIFFCGYEIFIIKRRIFTSLVIAVWHASILFIVCFGISAVKLIPVLEFKSLSMRDALPVYTSGLHLATVDSIKMYIGHFLSANSLHPDKYLFINILFLLFVIFSILRKTKETLFFLIVTLISFWAWMGSNAFIDLYSVFHKIIPGINTIQAPHRFILLTNFSIPILASFGVDFLRRYLRKRWKLVSNVVLSVIFIVLAIISTQFVKNQLTSQFVKEHINSQITEKNNKENLNFYLAKLPKDFKTVALYETTDRQVYPLTAFIYGFQLVNPPHPDYTPTYLYFPYWQKKPVSQFLQKKYTFLRIMNAGYIVAEKDMDDGPNEFLKKIHQISDGVVYKIKNPIPFINPSKKTILLFDDDTLKDFNSFKAKVLLIDSGYDPKEVAILTTAEKLTSYDAFDFKKFSLIVVSESVFEKNKKLIRRLIKQGVRIMPVRFRTNKFIDIRQRSASVTSAKMAIYLDEKQKEEFRITIQNSPSTGSSVKVVKISRTPETIDTYISVLGDRSFISISDTYYPGWVAYVDGKKSHLYMSNGLVKGLMLEGEGIHHIVLRFRPKSFYLGLSITSLTVLILTMLLLKGLKKKSIGI